MKICLQHDYHTYHIFNIFQLYRKERLFEALVTHICKEEGLDDGYSDLCNFGRTEKEWLYDDIPQKCSYLDHLHVKF